MNLQTAIEQLSQDDLGGIALPVFMKLLKKMVRSVFKLTVKTVFTVKLVTLKTQAKTLLG